MASYTQAEMQQVKLLEAEVNNYLNSKSNNPKYCVTLNKVLRLVLSNAMLPSKQIDIVWVDKPVHTFLMAVAPDINELYEKSEELATIMNNPKTSNFDFVSKWAEIRKWTIFIETRLLIKGDRFCVDSGDEFIALLYHEVGHVMSESPMHFIANYKLNSLSFKMFKKTMLARSRMVRFLLLPALLGTLTMVIVLKDGKSINNEINADLYVPDEYRGAMISYMENHILKSPESKNILITKEDLDNQQSTNINFSKESIEMLKTRRDVLIRSIQSQFNSPVNLPYQKELLRFIGKNLLGYSPDDEKYTSLSMKSITENAFKRDYELNSKIAKKAIMEASKVTDRDLDILQVQIEDISTPEDKMYFIHKLYDYIEAIGSEEKKLFGREKDIPKSLVRDTRLERLSNMRKDILAKDVSNGNKYGLYVKYPTGYEG